MKQLFIKIFTVLLFICASTIQAQAPAITFDKTFGGGSSDRLTTQIATSDGGFLLAGYSTSNISGDKTENSRGNYDYWVVKIDANGTKLWDKTFGGNSIDALTSLTATSDGGFLLGGRSISNISGEKTENSRGSNDYWVVKIDANGTKLWDKTFGGSAYDILNSLTATNDGGVLLGGISNSNISGDKTENSRGGDDYWVVKIDANGTKLWDKTFGGNSTDVLNSLITTSDGGFLLGGKSISNISGDKTENSRGSNDYWVVKIDANGTKLWDKTFGGNSTDILTSLTVTGDGGFLLAGYSISNISGDKTENSRGIYDYWVVKIDTNGTKLWDKTFGGSANDVLTSLITTGDGGFLLGGRSISNISGDKTENSRGGNDYWVVKIDTNGIRLWDKTLGGSSDDTLNSLTKTSDGGVLLGGFSISNISGDKTKNSNGGEDFWVVKLGDSSVQITPDLPSLPDINDACEVTPTAPTANGGTLTATADVSFPITTQGTTVVTWTYDDGNGNTETQTQNVILDDNDAPIAMCQDITVQLDASGNATIVAADIDNGSNDACGAVSLSIDITTFDCSDVSSGGGSSTPTCFATQSFETPGSGTWNYISNKGDATTGYSISSGSDKWAITSSNGGNTASDGSSFWGIRDINNRTYSGDHILEFSSKDVSLYTDVTISFDWYAEGFDNGDEIGYEVNYNNSGWTRTYLCPTDCNTQTSGVISTTETINVPMGTSTAQFRLFSKQNGGNDYGGFDNIKLCGTLNASSSGVPVELTVTDANGNVSTCTATVTVTVTVEDTIEPAAVCQNITVQLDDNGNATLVAADVDGGSTSVCSDVTLSIDNDTFDCSNIGTNNVLFTVTDASGNSSSCTAIITVEDNVAPNAMCQNITIQLDALGNASITAADIDNGSNDTCSSVTLSIDNNTFDCSHIGANSVTLTVTDESGNTASCTATVTVEDNIAPEVTCIVDATRDTDSGSCDYTVVGTELDATFTDNCSSGSITNDYTNSDTLDGAIFLQGDTIVTWTVDDGNGQIMSCTTTITVEDNEAPIVDCLNLQMLLDDSGTGSISIEDINNNSTDNCEIASITISQIDFDCSDIGGDLDALIISEYIDGSGNDDCIEIFNGTGNPVNLFEGNYSLLIYENGSATPTYSIPLLGTIADRDVYVICNPFGPGVAQADQTSGFAFDGNDAISLSRSGNAIDIIGEIGVDPGTGWNIAPNTTNGTTLVRKPTVLQGNINDVSGIGSEWIQYAQNTITHLGSHDIEIIDLANNIILTVTDTSGNVSICEGNVTVIDLIPPVASCQNVTIQLDEFGNASVAPSAVDNGSTDTCGIAGLALSQTDFTCDDIGDTTVTLTVTDRNGNTATCTATITVEDLIGSVVVTQDITVQLDDNGSVSITADDIDAGSTDACGIDTMSVSPDTFDCSNVGDNTVTLTVTDNNGNVTTGAATVTVEDMVSPDAICQNITVQLDATGNVSITGNDVDGGSTDTCGIVSYEVSPSMFTCAEIGDNTVTLTVTDAYGNSSTCTSIVTVEGIIPTVTISQGELPEFCQGAAVVLTANSAEAISYFWNSGETTESIEVTGNGTYGVLVTSATNCETYVEYTVTGFDAGSLIAAYTIIATQEVYLRGANLVQTGGVGAMSSSVGNIKLHQASTIVDFGQAVSFDLNQGSFIGNMIYAAANPTIPAFTYNTYSNNSSPDVTINNNQTQTLNGAVYDVVTVKQGATVIFSQSNVYINELKTFENASIEFTACANVFINDKFMLAQGGTINSNGNKVVFYVNEDVQIEKGSDVRASIHANNHEMLVKGSNGNGNNAGEPTYMTGLFIANRVHGNKNVIWNADSLCDPCPIAAPTGSNREDVATTEFSIDIDVIAWPNPSNSYFNLKLKTAIGTSDVTIEVFDVTNKLVHSNTFKYNNVYQFGSKLDGGVYIVKITQAGIEKSVRVIRY